MKRDFYKCITLVTTPGRAYSIMECLFKKNHLMLDVSTARGSFIGSKTNRHGEPIETEQEILTCIVKEEIADEVFADVYSLAGFDQPNFHAGFMYMQDLKTSTELKLDVA